MFICNACLEKKYLNLPMMHARSMGACDVCRKVRDCSDIRSSELERKPKSTKNGASSRFVAGEPKWGYIEKNEMHITPSGETRLYEARDDYRAVHNEEIPRATQWLHRRNFG